MTYFAPGDYMSSVNYNAVQKKSEGFGILNGLQTTPYASSLAVIVGTGTANVGYGTAVSCFTVSSPVTLSLVAGDTLPRKATIFMTGAGEITYSLGTVSVAIPEGNTGRKTEYPVAPIISSDSVFLSEIWIPSGADSGNDLTIYNDNPINIGSSTADTSSVSTPTISYLSMSKYWNGRNSMVILRVDDICEGIKYVNSGDYRNPNTVWQLLSMSDSMSIPLVLALNATHILSHIDSCESGTIEEYWSATSATNGVVGYNGDCSYNGNRSLKVSCPAKGDLAWVERTASLTGSGDMYFTGSYYGKVYVHAPATQASGTTLMDFYCTSTTKSVLSLQHSSLGNVELVYQDHNGGAAGTRRTQSVGTFLTAGWNQVEFGFDVSVSSATVYINNTMSWNGVLTYTLSKGIPNRIRIGTTDSTHHGTYYFDDIEWTDAARVTRVYANYNYFSTKMWNMIKHLVDYHGCEIGSHGREHGTEKTGVGGSSSWSNDVESVTYDVSVSLGGTYKNDIAACYYPGGVYNSISWSLATDTFRVGVKGYGITGTIYGMTEWASTTWMDGNSSFATNTILTSMTTDASNQEVYALIKHPYSETTAGPLVDISATFLSATNATLDAWVGGYSHFYKYKRELSEISLASNSSNSFYFTYSKADPAYTIHPMTFKFSTSGWPTEIKKNGTPLPTFSYNKHVNLGGSMNGEEGYIMSGTDVYVTVNPVSASEITISFKLVNVY